MPTLRTERTLRNCLFRRRTPGAWGTRRALVSEAVEEARAGVTSGRW
ncbi:Hypothetical protein CAP_4058 [Chondromyces apiculatus DSM 436]|uniref:Uncharacterized protein n=1 Tax=Chondromyces apiculatus DSM 436 TaxID=1192034 RepID=A0A017TGZ6_9BACT|nr:Hypothetical protein CAP_4058 [Chondromyces apiculatus DSM 436]